jgi:hypothetical protein
MIPIKVSRGLSDPKGDDTTFFDSACRRESKLPSTSFQWYATIDCRPSAMIHPSMNLYSAARDRRALLRFSDMISVTQIKGDYMCLYEGSSHLTLLPIREVFQCYT